MKNKIDKLKKFLQENYPNIQAFNNRNMARDYMENVYNEDNIQVDYAPGYYYIEIFGLSNEEFESLLDKSGRLKTFSEYKEQNKIDIQEGDRVTYRDITKDEVYIIIINDARDLISKEWVEKQITDGYIEILKIERPKYEVIEEKKELLTEEEKEFLKKFLELGNYGKITENRTVKFIEKTGCFIYFYYDEWYCNSIDINEDLYFRKLEENKKYTLQELGLDYPMKNLKLNDKCKN